MVLQYLLCDGQSQAGSILFSVADEGLENRSADGFGNALAIVRYSDLQACLDFSCPNFHGARLR